MKYDTILFDADGTLMDFADAEHQALLRTFADHKLHFDSEVGALYQSINQNLWKQFEQNLISKEQLLATRFASLFERLDLHGIDAGQFNREYLFNLGYGSKTIPQAVEVCRELSEKGCRLYILTNGVSDTQRRRLAASGLEPYLSGVFVSEEIGFQKPLREYFDYVFAHIADFDPHRALMVGDSLSSDMEGARRAGIDRCWFHPEEESLPAELPIQYEIHSLKDLLPFVFG